MLVQVKESSSKVRYKDELRAAMRLLAEHRAIFMGQAVEYPGTAMHGTLNDVQAFASWRLLEMPVAEDMQLGMAIGMSLNGLLPVCIYPRWNFLLLAASQLVLHLDKLPMYSRYRPKVIIRTASATPDPLHPGVQHLGDFSSAFREMLRTVSVVHLRRSEKIVPAYEDALRSKDSTILVEYSGLYT